jgi:YtcA family
MKNITHPSALVIVCLATAGCARNPNVDIAGSYFPGWMLALAGAVAATGAAHQLLRRKGVIRDAGHPALIYPSMVLLFTCLFWLCFFA